MILNTAKALMAAAGLLAAAVSPVLAGDLGVNVNGLGSPHLENTSGTGMLQRSNTTWVRMFVDMSEQRGKSASQIRNDPDIAAFRNLHNKGYKTILSLKWATGNRDFPGPGTQGRLDDFDVMRKVIEEAGGAGIDIVVVGNEPFRETKQSFRDQDMTDWYIRMAQEIRNFRNNNGYSYDIYMGSFNNVHKTGERTQVLLDLMDFAKNTSWIKGVDLHMHHEAIEDWGPALTFTKNQIGNKPIIVTEFSLMRYYKQFNTNNIPSSYANQYNLPGNKKVWEELRTLQNLENQSRWFDFVQSANWYESRKHYMRNVDRDYFDNGSNNIVVGTFALRQGRFANYGANSDAWIYNGLFCFSTCGTNSNGEPKDGYQWLTDFKARQ